MGFSKGGHAYTSSHHPKSLNDSGLVHTLLFSKLIKYLCGHLQDCPSSPLLGI